MAKVGGANYWWVPVAVAALGGLGFLVKDRIQMARNPGTILTFGDSQLTQVADVRLDGGQIVQAETGFHRFENVLPGKHQLAFYSTGRRSSVVYLEVKGGRETSVPFPVLSLASAPAPSASSPTYAPPADPASEKPQSIPRSAKKALLRVAVEGPPQIAAFSVEVGSSGTDDVRWMTSDLQPGPAELALLPGNQYTLVFNVAFQKRGELTIRVSTSDENGVLLVNKSLKVQGDPGETPNRTLVLL